MGEIDEEKVKAYDAVALLKDSEKCLKTRIRNRNRSRLKTPEELDIISRMRLERKDTLAKSLKAQEKFKDRPTEQATFSVVKVHEDE